MPELLDRASRNKQESQNLTSPGKREALNFPGLLEKVRDAVVPLPQEDEPKTEEKQKTQRKRVQKTTAVAEEGGLKAKKGPKIAGAKIL